MGTSSNDTSSSDDGFFTGTFDDPGEPGFSGPAYEGQDSDPSQDRRESLTEPGKTYNFNINREADYTVDDKGRRVYETIDPQMQELYDASGQFDKLDQLLSSGQASYLRDDGTIVSQDYQDDETINLIASQFDALDAVQADPKYAGQKTLLTADGNLYVKDPDLFDQAMTGLGEAFANTALGRLGGIIGGMTGFALSEGPIGANVGYYGGKALASGGLFGALNNKTFEAYSWENPLTGENITEQVFNNPITGESSRRFTTESEFRAQQQAEQELKDKYDSGDIVGNTEAFAEAVTGKRKPTWRDYVAGADGNFVDELFNNFTGAGDFANMAEPVRDGIVLAKTLADGGDPLTALISTFGDDVDEALGLSDLASDAVDATFNPETAQWLKDNSDLVHLGADIVVYNKDPSQAIVERYGENILDYLNADSKNQRAAGIAGLNIGVALDQGVDTNEALGKGVVDYFRAGGTVDTLIEVPDTLSAVLPDFDLPSINIPDLGIDWKGTWDELNRSANELLPAFDFNFGKLLDMGFKVSDFNLDNIDLSAFKPIDFGVEGFDIEGLEKLQSEGLDVAELDLTDLNVPEVAAKIALAEETIPGTRLTDEGDEIASLTPDLDFETEGSSLARKLLKRTFA